MIRALRDWHRRLFTGLALTLPLLFGALVLNREPRSAESRPLAAETTGGTPVGEEILLLAAPRISARLLADSGSSIPTAVEVRPAEDPAVPDLLLYWAPRDADGSMLSPEVVLLGPMGGSRLERFPLPEAASAGGRLLLYSGMRREVVGGSTLVAAP